MKKSLVRIVREYFEREDSSIRGLHRDQRDHFYSELYNFLVEKMRKTVKDLVARKRNELHANIIIPKEQAQIETEHVIEKTLGEPTMNRYKRLSHEQENLYNNQAKAEEYMLKLCEEMEGDQEALLEAAKFYMRRGEAQAEKAEKYLRDAYSFEMKNVQVAMMYACSLIQIGRFKEASVILKSLAAQGYETSKCYLLLQIAADMENDVVMSEKYKALALLDYMRSIERLPEAGSNQTRPPEARQEEKKEAEPKSEIEGGGDDTKSNKSTSISSSPAFNNVRLSQDEEN